MADRSSSLPHSSLHPTGLSLDRYCLASSVLPSYLSCVGKVGTVTSQSRWKKEPSSSRHLRCSTAPILLLVKEKVKGAFKILDYLVMSRPNVVGLTLN